ncbi:hypothetical protein [Brucella sp. BZ]|uniref:hypothetical protein n=1 Tax=Brucella sp. BZ TaxID=3381346 RepID=UPI0039EC66F3
MTKGNIENSREAFERAVIARMKESGFLEIEIRVEALVRCGDGYEDEVINAGWHYWKAGIAAATPPVVALPDDATAEEILKSTIDHPNAVVMLKRLPDAQASALEEAAYNPTCRPTAVRPGSLVNDADIRASDPPDVVVKKLDAAFDALASNPVDDNIAPDTDGKEPAATDTGLETVAENLARTFWGYFEGGPDAIAWFDNNKSLGGPAWLIEQCRSQAVELLAAERAKTERWHKKAMDAGVIVHSDGTTSHPMRKERDDLKADNARKDYLLSVSDTVAQQLQNQIVTLTLQIEALEAKLAAAIPPSGEGA